MSMNTPQVGWSPSNTGKTAVTTPTPESKQTLRKCDQLIPPASSWLTKQRIPKRHSKMSKICRKRLVAVTSRLLTFATLNVRSLNNRTDIIQRRSEGVRAAPGGTC